MQKQLSWFYKQKKEYGLSVALAALLNKLYFYGIHTDDLAYKINIRKHRAVISYLLKRYGHIIARYKDVSEYCPQEDEYSNTIWTIWWQGEENAPEHIKMCFQSMRKFSNGHDVIVISEKNIKKYAEIPEYVLAKAQEGTISFIHLADYIRMLLLREHGGLWLDATIFLTGQVPAGIFEYTYFTGRLPRTRMSCVSEGRWNGTLFGGKPHFSFFCYMVDMYNAYWAEHDQVIDYFLIDYLTEIACEQFAWFSKALNAVPLNNRNIFMMGEWLNDPFDKDKYMQATAGTVFHKMQRRNQYLKNDGKGEATFYGRLCDFYYNDQEIVCGGGSCK